ncbi:MAG: IMPACT family protein [Spirochaetota bacterium]
MFHVKHSDHAAHGAASHRDGCRDRPDLFCEPVSAGDYAFTEKKSRFIARLEPLREPAEVDLILERRRREFPDATHVVHAYACGFPRPVHEGCSDDREPHGTAGRPVLESLGYARITNAAITVVRYFGGTRLGTGGLVRAYGGAARGAIDQAVLRACVERLEASISVPYELYEPVRRILQHTGTEVISETFRETVALQLSLEARKREELAERLRDVSSGGITLD